MDVFETDRSPRDPTRRTLVPLRRLRGRALSGIPTPRRCSAGRAAGADDDEVERDFGVGCQGGCGVEDMQFVGLCKGEQALGGGGERRAHEGARAEQGAHLA